MKNALAKHRLFILVMILLAVLVCGVPAGIFTALNFLFPSPTPDPQEIAIRNEVATKLGIEPDWNVIFDYVSEIYIPLGLTQAQVHDRLASLGSFTIEREEHYYLDVYNRDVDDEFMAFNDPFLNKELGKRGYTYDSNTGLLIESYVLFESGESARLLPPPP